MDARDLVRSVRNLGSVRGLRMARSAWRRYRADALGLPARGAERARVPGASTGADPLPGGGVVRFARSQLRIVVTAGGAVFLGWDGAEPLPSYGLGGHPPEPDPRAGLEPDKDGGWRVVSERLTVEVSRHGAVEFCTPGGVVLRRDQPPRWWEPAGGGPARWVLRSQVPADARVFGLGDRAAGPRLREGTYRLWNGGPGSGGGPDAAASQFAMPVQMVVADAGTHLAFHDTTWDGRVTVREGTEGAGSGHDRPGTVEMRVDGGPLRCWVAVGTPARALSSFVRLAGAPALPPAWALGLHHRREGLADEQAVRRLVRDYRDHGLPLAVVHLEGPDDAAEPFGLDRERFPDPAALAKDLREEGVRLVRVVAPTVAVRRGSGVYEAGARSGAYVRDARGAEVIGVAASGDRVHPDFTDPGTRAWWGGLYEGLPEQGFSGAWHEAGEEAGGAPVFDGMALPRSARHAVEGRGGDHREAHNVEGLAMLRAAYEGMCRLRPAERPFLASSSGWAGVQRYGGAWSGGASGGVFGDARAAGWPGLRASLSRVLGLGVCGVPFSGAGSADGGDGGSAELYLRRLQLGAFLPLFHTHTVRGTAAGEPWEFGPEVLAHARAALRERERLHPYLVGLAHMARLTGAPLVRPLWWGSPGDRVLRDCGDVFLLGDALLVAPVLEPGADRRAVRLPRGRWYDTATGVAYDGPGQVLVDAPLSRIPVLARAGSVLAVRGEDGRTELEVWAPAAGRKGGGLVVRDAGDGWALSEIERYATRLADGRVVVERVTDEGRMPVEGPVRVRGQV